MRGTRILQILGDTDADRGNAEALELHALLSSIGAEVRTLALAPGRSGGLETTVPVIAPSRHSFAARSGCMTESRWADLLVLSGRRALVLATMPRRNGPTVIARLDPSGEDLEISAKRIPAMVARRAGLVVVPAHTDPGGITAHWDLDPARVRRASDAAEWSAVVAECLG